MSLEKYLIDHCASTLASLKMGSLFNVDCDSEEELRSHVAAWNRVLGEKGVCMTILRTGGEGRKTALIYVYRRRKLMETLGREDVMDFLKEYGYESIGRNDMSAEEKMEHALEILRFHLAPASSVAPATASSIAPATASPVAPATASTGKSAYEFPHEIGVFLDYPLGDVIGFIENRGKNFKCSGCWKVYDDPESAEKLFGKFRKCRAVYRDMWEKGRSVCQLTVNR